MKRFLSRALALLVVVCLPVVANAQSARPGRVQVTVVDPSGGGIPGASVTLTSLESAPPARERLATTNEVGVALIEAVAPGRYRVEATFPDYVCVQPATRRHGPRQDILISPPSLIACTVRRPP